MPPTSMPPTQRVLAILQTVATYYTLTRAMIQEQCLPNTGKDGCIARKLLNQLRHEGLINQTRCQVANPNNGSAAPVYYPSRKGCELLAQETGDDRWLRACTLTPNWQLLHHWTDIAKFHILLDRAIASQHLGAPLGAHLDGAGLRLKGDNGQLPGGPSTAAPGAAARPEASRPETGQSAEVLGFLHEWDVANPTEKDPAARYRLFVELRRAPRLVFAPDAAFLLGYRGFKKVYYVEMDRGTSGVQQIAASKTPGVVAMAEQGLHARHFAATNVESFTMLMVTLTANRRDALRRAIAGKPGARWWKFSAWSDLTPATLLYEPVLRDHEGQAVPLLKRPAATTPQTGTDPGTPPRTRQDEEATNDGGA